ncbi:tetratricopeptide repeat protein [Lysinibacillus piscis]|uniref:Tetratricopeptide repeat protein n=1 Tax=Lysinibacillus piscis TaxID=2518931 RepID=A0ABQ5NHV4_9BACI|nr:hypothetical protein [Lysinibacillus sp. KH24]GLC87893.1 hypothetical protein LYSBPC_10200 [Lysinibacillus sp. KH24]
MTFTEPIRKYILSGVVTFVVIGLIVANVLASKQDEEFLMNETLYNQAIQLQSTGDLPGAKTMISEVLKKQPNSEVANYAAALTMAQTGDMKQAAIHMQKVLDMNPYKVEDARFMMQFGEILVGAERYEDAKIVLLRCQEAQWTLEDVPNYQEQVAAMLAQIENSQSKEGTKK